MTRLFYILALAFALTAGEAVAQTSYGSLFAAAKKAEASGNKKSAYSYYLQAKQKAKTPAQRNAAQAGMNRTKTAASSKPKPSTSKPKPSTSTRHRSSTQPSRGRSNSGTYITVNNNRSETTYSPDGGSHYADVTVNTDADSWTTWGVPSWCSISERTSNSFRLNIEANPGEARSDYMEVRTPSGKRARININQGGATGTTGTLTVDGTTSDKSCSFSGGGGRLNWTVSTSDYDYETWGVPSWCSIENKTSTSFDLVAEPNPNTTERSDYMKVKAAGKEIRIDIKQKPGTGITAEITNVWTDFNVWNGLVKGMKIHCKFDVNGMKGRSVQMKLAFFYDDNVTPLKSTYGTDLTATGNYHSVTYDNATFSDLWIFVPYTALNMAAGFNGSLSFDVMMLDYAGNVLARKNNNQFTFSN